MAKKTEAAPKQQQIVAKQIGQNIIIVMPDKKKFSKKFTEAVVREDVKALIVKYNKKNTDKALKEITNIFNPSKEKEEKKAMEKKGLKTAIKKEKKAVKVKAKKEKGKVKSNQELIEEVSKTELSPEEVTKMRSILKQYDEKAEEKPAPIVQQTRRSGEH